MPFRRRDVLTMVVANVLYEKSVFFKYSKFAFHVTSRDRRKSVANGELTLQPNHSKSFLKWRLS